MPLSLTDRVVLVTGAARGLGRSHCLELASRGAIVVVNDVADEDSSDASDRVLQEVREMGGEGLAVTSSVADLGAMEDVIATIVEAYGRLDVVVNNAGILRDRMIASMSEAEFDAVIEVHLKGTWAVSRAAVSHWRQRAKQGEAVDARIINTTSGTGLFGNVGQANYGMAKAGIANFTTIAAMELERYGVTVNAISPIARTRMTAQLSTMPDREDVDVDRFDPIHASRVVAWLASRESRWVTGAIFRVDGPTVHWMRPWEIDRDRTYVGGRDGIDPTALDEHLRGAVGIRPTGIPVARR